MVEQFRINERLKLQEQYIRILIIHIFLNGSHCTVLVIVFCVKNGFDAFLAVANRSLYACVQPCIDETVRNAVVRICVTQVSEESAQNVHFYQTKCSSEGQSYNQ